MMHQQQALNTSWSEYSLFKNFTDLKFTKMNEEEYLEIEKYIIEKSDIMASYPAKNSIMVYKNKVVLFLNVSNINKKITR